VDINSVNYLGAKLQNIFRIFVVLLEKYFLSLAPIFMIITIFSIKICGIKIIIHIFVVYIKNKQEKFL